MQGSVLNILLCYRWAGTGNQVLGNHGQRIEPNTEFIAEREQILSNSILHRTWEQDNSEQRLNSGAGGILFL